MLNHKTVLEWPIANDNFLQYAMVIEKFSVLHITSQAIDINRLHFNIKVYKDQHPHFCFYVLVFISIMVGKLSSYLAVSYISFKKQYFGVVFKTKIG